MQPLGTLSRVTTSLSLLPPASPFRSLFLFRSHSSGHVAPLIRERNSSGRFTIGRLERVDALIVPPSFIN